MLKFTIAAIGLATITTGAQAKDWVAETVRHMHSLGYEMHTLELCGGAANVDQSKRAALYEGLGIAAKQLCDAAFAGDMEVCQEHLDEGRGRVDITREPACAYVMGAASRTPKQIEDTLTPVERPEGVSPEHWDHVVNLTTAIKTLNLCVDQISRDAEKMQSRRVSHAIDDACNAVPEGRGVCGGAFTAADQHIDAQFMGKTGAERERYLTKICPSLEKEAHAIAEDMLEGLVYGEVYRPSGLGSYTRRDLFRAAYLFLNSGFGNFGQAYEKAVENYSTATTCQFSAAVNWDEKKAEKVYEFWSSLAEDLYSEGMLTDDHSTKAHEEADFYQRILERGDRSFVRSECARIAIGIE